MKNDRVRQFLTLLLAAVLLLGCQAAFAQVRIVGSIDGKVQDPSGSVVPGAKVTLKDEGTGISKEVVASAEGTFTFPDLAHGLYQVTATAPGFQQSVVQHVEVAASQTTDLPITLKVGQSTETVTVEGVAPVLETTSNLMSNTQNTKLVNELPTSSRSPGLAFAVLSPGYTGGFGGGGRVNNVAGGAVSTTIDGINNASNGYKSGGTVWYNTVPLRLGALEEVSVEAGGLGADAGAESGVNVKLITRRGTNTYHGSAFYQPQSEQFSANTWSRNATPGQGFRSYNRVHNFGGNLGGRLVPFGVLKDKLFFFVNYEYVWTPNASTVTSTVMTPAAEAGNYTYLNNGTTNQYTTINVLTLAKAAGFPSAIDPVISSYTAYNDKLTQYSTQVQTTDQNRTSWAWQHDTSNYFYYPTTRFDYYITPKEQFTFSWNVQHGWNPGSTRFPMPDSKKTGPFRQTYFIWSGALQSTLGAATFNEFRYGVQHSGDSNASATANYGTVNTYNGQPLRIGSVGTTNAQSNLPFGTPTPYIDQQNTTGRHFITTITDTFTHIKGQHTIRAGGNIRKTVWKDVWEVFPYSIYTLGTPSGDPIPGTLFTAANMPNAASAELGNSTAASLYNQLTGRISQAAFRTVINPDTKQYGNFLAYNWSQSVMGGLWAQDSWRVRSNLTINFGLRWEVQGDMNDPQKLSSVPTMADIYGPSTALFTPGKLSGLTDPTANIGIRGYNPDYLNFAPNAGIAWNPKVESGFLGKLLGGNKTAIRANYSMTYFDEGTLMYSGAYQCGPGQGIGCNAGKNTSAAIVAGTAAILPQFSTLGQVAAAPLTQADYPSIGTYNPVLHQSGQTFLSSFFGMKPTLVAPYLEQWSLGVQRELSRGTVLEVRYVGNGSHRQWRTFDLNETNIFENGFLTEFQHAQNNLAIANGLTLAQLTLQPSLPACPSATSPYCMKTFNFANQGLPGQVDLPILTAAFGPRGTVPAVAATSGFSSTTFGGYLQNGAAGTFASAMTTNTYFCRMMGNSFGPCLGPNSGAGTGQSYNAAGAGMPINFWRLNPYTSTMNYVDDVGYWGYEGLQVQLRRTFNHGLTGTFNYALSHAMANTNADNATNGLNFLTLRNESLDRRPSIFDQRHTVSAYMTYDLPIGKDKLINLKNKWLDFAFGEWTSGHIFQFATGTPQQIGGAYGTLNGYATNNAQASTGVQLAPGVTLAELNDALHSGNYVKINQSASGDTRLFRGTAQSLDLSRLAVPLSLVASDGRASQQLIGWAPPAGTLGQILFIPNINTWAWNVSLMKNYRITERMKFQLYGKAQNVMNHPTWGLPTISPSSTNFGVVGAPSGSRTMQFRGLFSF